MPGPKLPLTITPKALEKINEIRANKNIPTQYGLRLGMKGGGCMGMSYVIGFDTPNDTDDTYQIADLEIFIAKAQLMYLIGITLDYYEEDDGVGFAFLKEVEVSQ